MIILQPSIKSKPKSISKLQSFTIIKFNFTSSTSINYKFKLIYLKAQNGEVSKFVYEVLQLVILVKLN